ncbi:MAG: hypothetical protein Q9178_005577 [Gyalolechia marmorata]
MVRRMMKYFYFLDYFEDEDDDRTSATFSELELHVQMFSMGDKYDVICLKNMAAIKFRDCCEEHNIWDSENKREAAVKALVSAVPAVYANTPDDDVILRPPLVNTITERLNKDSALLHELKDMCLQYPQFSYDLMEATWRVAHPEHGRQYWGGSRGGSPPVAIELLRGPAENILPIACLTSSSPNTGKFVWTPPTSLTADVSRYGLRIIVADGSGQFQYSNQFGISNDAINQPTSSSLPTKSESTTSHPTKDSSTTSPVIPSSVITSSIAANTTTATVPLVTPDSNSSSVVVIATTHVPIPVLSSGAIRSMTILQPTNNMTIPASLKASKTQAPSGVTASASATSVQTGTGSPIAGPGTTAPNSGAGKLLAGSMLAVLAAMGALLL